MPTQPFEVSGPHEAVEGPQEVVDRAGSQPAPGKPRLTLQERLELYDPAVHGGQFVDDEPVGRERS